MKTLIKLISILLIIELATVIGPTRSFAQENQEQNENEEEVCDVETRNIADDTSFTVPNNKTEIYVDLETGAVYKAKQRTLIPEARYDSCSHKIYYKNTISLYGTLKTLSRGYVNIRPNKPGLIMRWSSPEPREFLEENRGGSSNPSNRDQNNDEDGDDASNDEREHGSATRSQNSGDSSPGGGGGRRSGNLILDPLGSSLHSSSGSSDSPDSSGSSGDTGDGDSSGGGGGGGGSGSLPGTPSVQLFKDVPKNQYYTKPAEEAAKRGWIAQKTYFEPSRPMTRCEFATIVIKALGTPLADKSEYYAGFKDLPEKNHPDARHVYTGILKKYWRGQEDGSQTFGCQKGLIRAEMAVVLAKVLDLKEEGTYQPQDSVPTWALPAIRKAHEAGLMKGLGDGTNWGASLTLSNADAVTALFRAFGNQN